MGKKDEAMDPLRTLRKRLQEMSDGLNVNLENVAFMVGQDEGDPDIIQAVFIITPESLKTQAELEDARIDKEFERMMSGEDFMDKAKETLASDDLDLDWDDDA